MIICANQQDNFVQECKTIFNDFDQYINEFENDVIEHELFESFLFEANGESLKDRLIKTVKIWWKKISEFFSKIINVIMEKIRSFSSKRKSKEKDTSSDEKNDYSESEEREFLESMEYEDYDYISAMYNIAQNTYVQDMFYTMGDKSRDAKVSHTLTGTSYDEIDDIKNISESDIRKHLVGDKKTFISVDTLSYSKCLNAFNSEYVIRHLKKVEAQCKKDYKIFLSYTQEELDSGTYDHASQILDSFIREANAKLETNAKTVRVVSNISVQYVNQLARVTNMHEKWREKYPNSKMRKD